MTRKGKQQTCLYQCRWASALDYWQFGRSNVRPHRTCSLHKDFIYVVGQVCPTDVPLRTLFIVLGRYAQPTSLCISRLNVLVPRVPPVRKSAMPNRCPEQFKRKEMNILKITKRLLLYSEESKILNIPDQSINPKITLQEDSEEVGRVC